MKTCTIEDCDREHRARGMCSMHYRRWERANGKARPPSDMWSPRRQANWRERRARRKGSERTEIIYYDSIYRRDKHTCGICHEPVDPSLEWPDPMSASLDHRIPLSAGGSHTRDNVQCAHFRCNARKGTRQAPSLTA